MIFERQSAFQKNFYDPNSLTLEEKINLSKEFLLSIHRETTEVLDCMAWKLHRPKDKKVDIDHLNEELIDVIKFTLNLFIIWGIDHKQFYKKFLEKSKIVEKRYDEEFGRRKRNSL